MSKSDEFSDSAWHLRGAITGTLFGFGDQDSSIAEFFMAPIDPASNGLSDYNEVVHTSLPGIRFLLTVIDRTTAPGYLKGLPQRVMDHFNFYTKYQVII